MKALIIGGSGFLGTALVRRATAAGRGTAATYCSRPGSLPGAAWHQLDLRAPGHIDEVLAAADPDVVINATSGGSDWAVTADGSIRVAMAAAQRGCRLVHVSSDAVFSGSPLSATRPVCPVRSPRMARRRPPPRPLCGCWCRPPRSYAPH